MGFNPLRSVLYAFSPQGDYFPRASTQATLQGQEIGLLF